MRVSYCFEESQYFGILNKYFGTLLGESGNVLPYIVVPMFVTYLFLHLFLFSHKDVKISNSSRRATLTCCDMRLTEDRRWEPVVYLSATSQSLLPF